MLLSFAMGSVCEALKALCKSLEFACTCRALWREADAQAHSCASEVAQAVGLDAVLAKQAAVCTSTTMSDEGGPGKWWIVRNRQHKHAASKYGVLLAPTPHTSSNGQYNRLSFLKYNAVTCG